MIVVSSAGKVKDLTLSADLTCLQSVRTRWKRCNIEVFCLGVLLRLPEEPTVPVNPYKYSRNGKPFANCVYCKETGLVYSSVRECSRATGVSAASIYKSIRLNYTINGFTFEYAAQMK